MALTFKELLAITPTTPAARMSRPTSIPTMTCAKEKR
jgi:hypothetical protein